MAELTAMQQEILKFYHANTFMEYVHGEFIPTADGDMELQLTVEAEHTNLYGIAHGGILMTMADTASGAACLVKNKKVVTINLAMDFMHSVPLTTRLIAKGKVLHNGRRTMVCECEIRDAAGKLYAKSHGTFYVLGLLVEQEEKS